MGSKRFTAQYGAGLEQVGVGLAQCPHSTELLGGSAHHRADPAACLPHQGPPHSQEEAPPDNLHPQKPAHYFHLLLGLFLDMCCASLMPRTGGQ